VLGSKSLLGASVTAITNKAVRGLTTAAYNKQIKRKNKAHAFCKKHAKSAPFIFLLLGRYMPPRIRMKLLSGLCVYTEFLALVSFLFCGDLRVHRCYLAFG
jgi:hypothetical protein